MLDADKREVDCLKTMDFFVDECECGQISKDVMLRPPTLKLFGQTHGSIPHILPHLHSLRNHPQLPPLTLHQTQTKTQGLRLRTIPKATRTQRPHEKDDSWLPFPPPVLLPRPVSRERRGDTLWIRAVSSGVASKPLLDTGGGGSGEQHPSGGDGGELGTAQLQLERTLLYLRQIGTHPLLILHPWWTDGGWSRTVISTHLLPASRDIEGG